MVFEMHEEYTLVFFSFGEDVALGLVTYLWDGMISSRLITNWSLLTGTESFQVRMLAYTCSNRSVKTVGPAGESTPSLVKRCVNRAKASR